MSTTFGEHTKTPVATERMPEAGLSVFERARQEIAANHKPVFHAAVDNLAKGAPSVDMAISDAYKFSNAADCFIGQCSASAKGALSDLFPNTAKGQKKGWSLFS